jgi:undecaprenyl-diphosphatase
MANSTPARLVHWRFVAALLLLTALWLAMLVAGGGQLDGAIYEALYAGRRPVLAGIARIFTALGDPTVLIGAGIAAAFWLWHVGCGRLGVALLAVTVVGRLLTEAQKYWIARARPDLEPHLVVVKTTSFPSGHATSSMIFYLSLALMLTVHHHGRWRLAGASTAMALSVLVGLSRVMLGVHWPSDVVGGWAFGLLWVLLTLRPAERLFRVDSG